MWPFNVVRWFISKTGVMNACNTLCCCDTQGNNNTSNNSVTVKLVPVRGDFDTSRTELRKELSNTRRKLERAESNLSLAKSGTDLTSSVRCWQLTSSWFVAASVESINFFFLKPQPLSLVFYFLLSSDYYWFYLTLVSVPSWFVAARLWFSF